MLRYGAVDVDSEDSWRGDLEARPDWPVLRKNIRAILECDWWGRAWIIQEVVMGREVIVQIGCHTFDWEPFSKFVGCEACSDQFPMLVTPDFVADIRNFRIETHSGEAISINFLALASRFRFQAAQAASFGSDKIYALLGLLASDNPTRLVPDYNKNPEEGFLSFVVSCIEHNNNLSAIALAAGVELRGTSWCHDWRSTSDGQFSTLQLCALPPPDVPEYSASGACAPILDTDLNHRVLSLKGYEVDVVVKTREYYQDDQDNVDWLFALKGWEQMAGGPWQDSHVEDAFHRTITGNRWNVKPLDWKSRIQAAGKPPRNEEDRWYLKTIKRICQNRRFLVTRSGRFVLGPWNLRKRDKVYILFGGKTPFVLRLCRPPRGDTAGRMFHTVVGEAIVNGLVYY